MTDSDLQAFFTKVDGSYPTRKKDLAPVITWKTNKIPVARQFRLPIPVEHSSTVVDYSFETVNNDIEFGVLFSTATDSKEGLLGPGTGVGSRTGKEEEDIEEEEEVVVERQRFASHLGPVTGTFHLARPGRLTLVWENGYSWFKNKVLSYSVTRRVSSVDVIEKAKCSRAATALVTCTKDKNDAGARAAGAGVEARESDSKVEELKNELEELQGKLDRERQRSEALWKEVEDMERRGGLEELKIQGLAFRVMPVTLLDLTLSFGSKKDQWSGVCKDWHDVLHPEGEKAPKENGGYHVEGEVEGEEEGQGNGGRDD